MFVITTLEINLTKQRLKGNNVYEILSDVFKY
jgi:hypothetical protein